MMRWLATTGPRTGSFLCSSTPWLCGRLDKLNVNQLACKVSLCWFMLFQGMREREARMPLVWCVVSKRGLQIKHRERVRVLLSGGRHAPCAPSTQVEENACEDRSVMSLRSMLKTHAHVVVEEVNVEDTR